MRGSIIKRTKDAKNYTIVLDMGRDPTTGKRKRQWITAGTSKREAEKRLAELLHQLNTGAFVKPGKLAVQDYLTQWLRDTAYPNMSPRTYEQYEYMTTKHIIPAIGHIPLTQLKPQQLQHLYGEKLASKLNRTAEYIHFTLHRALQDAVKMGVLSRNPADAVERPRASCREMHIMNESEIHTFLEYARATPYYPLFYLALFTGMRRSELLALKWGDVDLLLCQISVNRSLHQLRYGTYRGQILVKQPKTARGRRLIALSPSTVQVLQEHRTQQEALRQQLGFNPVTDDDYVFGRYDGKPYLPDSVSHAWLKLAKRTGINVRLHDARHTHASLMLKQGIHPKVVCERLGHHSIEVTIDTYSHITPGLQQAAAARFDEIISSPKIKTREVKL